jgi:hypothetical protein
MPDVVVTLEGLQQWALAALSGVGSVSLGQWEEWTGQAYHVRRRLSRDEQRLVGEPLDIRGTEEAERRHKAMVRYLPVHLKDWKE